MNRYINRIKNRVKGNTIFKKIESTSVYRNHIWYHIFKYVRKKALLREATEEFQDLLRDQATEVKIDMADYKRALNKNLVSFSEYAFQYDFPKLTDDQRKEYVSRLEMRLWYERNTNSNYIQNLFYKKSNWLNHFKKFVNRQWINPEELTFESFIGMVNKVKEYIAKPNEGSLGLGIYKVNGKDIDKALFEKLRDDKYILEELVVNEATLGAFHPHSLNTIRIMSLRSGEIVGSFIRFGNNGNIVDNAHAGGIFAQVDLPSGKILTDGINTCGETYERHPYSGIIIKGFLIPKWSEIKNVVKQLHQCVPLAAIVGWDICINQNGEIEVIEGNHMPDIDLIQSPQKQGVRNRLNMLLKNADLPQLGKL